MGVRQPADIPATEAREQISEVISRVAYGGERVVISRNGKAQVAVVSILDLDRLKQFDELKDMDRRQAAAAIARMQEHATKTGLDKLTDEEIEAEISEARKVRRRAGR